jgi:AraC-like DNA-binding protein
MTYWERPTLVTGAVLWGDVVTRSRGPIPILPDGCLDLLWDGHQLLVAGPDSTARWHQSPRGAAYVALRFSGGTGPALLGVPAHELLDTTVGLAELWPSRSARALAEGVAADPVRALAAWAVERSSSCAVDPLGPRVLAMATTGTPVATMADRLGLSLRQLHRLCLPTFGYGPRRLARVLRLGRSLEAARTGGTLAQAAASCGYADHAHLSREVRAFTGMTPTMLVRRLVRS